MSRVVLPEDALDATDRAILNAVQEGFPIVSHPFAEAGAALGIGEAEMITRIARLRDIGAITRFGPFFDAAAMGGAFCLCAMDVPPARFDEVMTKVNAHPEVAHNYERAHALNMWFVLATETPDGIAEAIARIERDSGLTVHAFPKEREFFVEMKLEARL